MNPPVKMLQIFLRVRNLIPGCCGKDLVAGPFYADVSNLPLEKCREIAAFAGSRFKMARQRRSFRNHEATDLHGSQKITIKKTDKKTDPRRSGANPWPLKSSSAERGIMLPGGSIGELCHL
jgi:hypothetical protein